MLRIMIALALAAAVPAAPSTGKSSAEPHRMVLDAKGDGIDLTGTHPTLKVHWTKAGTDDAFVAVDADELALLGYRVEGADRTPRRGAVLLAGNLRVTRPDGGATDAHDGWELLAALDGNRDGVLDAKDNTWRAMRLFVDANADGVVAPAEVRKVLDTSIARLGPRGMRPAEKGPGGTYLEGTFARSNDTMGRVADVALSKVDERVSAAARQ